MIPPSMQTLNLSISDRKTNCNDFSLEKKNKLQMDFFFLENLHGKVKKYIANRFHLYGADCEFHHLYGADCKITALKFEQVKHFW